MASVFRFRVTTGVGSGRLAVGPKAYASGQEFTLTDDQVARWLDERMFELGYLVMADELGYDEPQAWNSLAEHLVSGKSGQISNRYEGPWNLEQKYMTVNYTASWSDTVDQNDLAEILVEEDCVFESAQFPGITLAALAAATWRFNIKKLPQGVKTPVDILDTNGTTIDTLGHCAYGTSTSLTDQTDEANDATANDVVMRLMDSTGQYVYIGYYDRFDGFWMDIGTTVNAAAATATYEYSKVTDSGTIDWTTIPSFTDGTVSSNKAFAQNGSVYWMRPGDWGKTTISSMASGAAPLYFIRCGDATDGTDFTSGTDADRLWLLSRCLRPKDNLEVYCAKGDILRIDSPLYATGAIGGIVTTGSTQVVLSFRATR